MPFKKGNKYGGRRGRTSGYMRTPGPVVDNDASDEEVAQEAIDGEEAREDNDEAATPVQDADEEEDDDDDADSEPAITAMPRRRSGKLGARSSARRGPNTPEPPADDGSESGTPFKRRRGRPPGTGTGPRSRGGFRGRRRGAPPEAPKVVDEFGQQLEVIDDEAQVDDDEEGNTKVDEKGHLQGGRQYRVRTFTIIGRGDRLYMLSTEPARCCGFRDSYLFFAKHPKLYKVLINDAEKKDLIDRDILPSSYKGRNIGVVTARSVFREFGARIIVAGRKVTDDYKVAEARANGEVEGELADPDDRVPEKSEEYNRNRYVAWFGASEVYRNAGQAAAGQANKSGLMGKRRNNITLQNWQSVHAREASRFNSSLAAFRRANLDGVYDTNTNMMLYPKIMQPTHARWEQIPPPQPPKSSHSQPRHLPLPNGHAGQPNGKLTFHHEPEVTMFDVPAHPSPSQPSLFTPVPAVISRNFAVIDVAMESPPISHAGYPGPDGEVMDFTSGTAGLSTIPDDIVAELPASCAAAFAAARDAERDYKARWQTETQSGHRRRLNIGFTGYPV